MKKITNILSNLPIFLYLCPLLLFLFGFNEHGYHLEYYPLIINYLYIYFSIIFVHFLIHKYSNRKKLHSLIFYYYLATFLFFAQLKETFMLIPKVGSYIFFLPTIFFFPFIFYKLTQKKNNFKFEFYKFVNIAMIIFCIQQLIIIPFNKPNHKLYELKNEVNLSVNTNKTPSIHLLLFDGYPSFIVLEKYFSFSNNEIKRFLNDNGFFIHDSIFSNYYYTNYSINSILNFQYLPYLENSNSFNNRFYIVEQINENKLVKFLKVQNYEINNQSIFTILNQKNVGNILSSRKANYFHFRGIFHNKIIADIAWNFGLGKYKINYFYHNLIMNQHYANQTIIKKLLTKKYNKKHFTYSHIIMPHDPYYTDSTGNLINSNKIFDLSNKQIYLSYLKRTNNVIKKIINKLRKSEPNSIIILMSDHGFRELGRQQTDSIKCSNFFAVYLPNKDYSKIKMIKSNVNIFRCLLNQYFKQNLPYIIDRQFWIE